ncbi:MAG: DsbA family protein [Parvibaculum sp.]|uniref:DsbA family protein n=1 Tax=Parvibaculum sp. TaxID=2024848 RepID=UPI0028458A74|nr:DsbA family protein [Parvibaculum sp.]MDR3498090.1 DsbA family protein [Parvibaculum sp.]
MMRALVFAAAMLGFIASAGVAMAAPQTAPKSFSDAQTRSIETIVHDYLLKHPEVLLEAMQAYDDKQAAAKAHAQNKAVAANRAPIYDDPTSFVAGNPQGDVTIVEFFDYQCGYCKRVFEPLMDEIKKDGNIRLILKEFPILGPKSVVASHAALASMKQGKYFEFHQALFRNKAALTDDRIIEIAKSVGIDPVQMKKDMADPKIIKIIDRNEELARALAIDGTPGFVIGDKVHAGALDADELAAEVKAARAGQETSR